jgi:hypothetical protein
MSERNFLNGIALVLAGGLGLAHAENAPRWTDALTKEATTSGFQATLPPHVSMVLGLTKKGESIAVRQLVSRAGQKVHTFNVVVADKGDIVVFVVNEKEQSTVAYLLTARGTLRGAVSYQTGGEPHELAASEAKPGLAREIRYWSDYAAGGSAPKPPGAQQRVKAPNPADVPKPADSPKPPGGPTTP